MLVLHNWQTVWHHLPNINQKTVKQAITERLEDVIEEMKLLKDECDKHKTTVL